MEWQSFWLTALVIGIIFRLAELWLKRSSPRRNRPRYVHVKSQGRYEVLEIGRRESDCVMVVIYRSLETRAVWVRDYNEFFDGRFVLDIAKNERK